MKVTDLMSRDLVMVPRDTSVARAIELMIDRRVSSVLIEREGPDGPWGIVTRSDVVKKLAAHDLDARKIPVTRIMCPALITIDPGLDVGYASRLMRRFGIRHLPVVQGETLLGILSYHDVLRVFHLLRSIPFFERLPIADLVALMTVSSARNCGANEILIREGTTGRDLYILEDGEMVVSTRRAGRIARIRSGELFGEVELFGGVRSATVRAARDSRVLVIDGKRFVEVASSRDRLGAVVFESMARHLSERLRRANRFLFLRGIWSHRALVLRILGIAAVVFVGLVLGTATVSEAPSFCKSCHNMQPYHASWEASSHANVRCTKCHWSYGLKGAVRGKITGVAMVVRYATGTHGPKPEAEVDDASCLRKECHGVKTKASVFRGDDGDSVRFDHTLHLNSLRPIGRLRCTSCHVHRGQQEHFSVTASTCALCHFPQSEAGPTPCLGCHHFAKPSEADRSPLRVDHSAFESGRDCLACHRNVVSGRRDVDPDRCLSCHNRPDTLSVGRIHRVHVREEDVDCLECHARLEHPGPSDRILAGRCDGCHIDPHAAQERLYLGKGGAGVAERPALMFYYHVECTACHQAHDSETTPQACLECHDVTFQDRLRMWRTQLERSRTEVRRLLSDLENKLGPDGSRRFPEAYRLYREAVQNYQIVAADPSAGVHNFRYADDLMKTCRAKINEATRLLTSSEGG